MHTHETELMLKGYGLTTAELYYRMPDYRNVLNSFVWQDYMIWRRIIRSFSALSNSGKNRSTARCIRCGSPIAS